MPNQHFLPVMPCISMAGDPKAGILLHRLLFWMDHAPVQHGGLPWVAFTRERWSNDTQMSPKQIRRALTILSEGDLISREQHIFENRTPLFLRPSPKLTELLPGLRKIHAGADE